MKLDTKTEILNIANLACLKISNKNNTVEVKHKINFSDKSIWGILFFLFGGVLFIGAPFIKTSDTISKLLGILIGFSFILLSALTLIRQVSDRVIIKKGVIKFVHNLKTSIISLDKNSKVKMKTEIREINREVLGSKFIIVSHHLHHLKKEVIIFEFQIEESNLDKALLLGKEIKQLINTEIEKQT